MGKVEEEIKDLQEKLALLKKDRKNKLEIKRLKKQIKSEVFEQSKGGKIFNKIADVGDVLGKKLMKGVGSGKTPKKKKKKIESLSAVMDRLPQ